MASMGPGFFSPEYSYMGNYDAALDAASMGPGFFSPEYGCLDADRRGRECFNGAGLFQPGIPGQHDSADIFILLQWGRAFSARNTAMHRNVWLSGPGFNGAGLFQPGIPPGYWYILPASQASMGPGFFSPEYLDGTSAILNTLSLQWGRAFSARNTATSSLQFLMFLCFNGAGLFQPGIPNQPGPSNQQIMASMGPGFFSPEYQSGGDIKFAVTLLQWGRAFSARNTLPKPKLKVVVICFNGAGLFQPGIPAKNKAIAELNTLQWGRAFSARNTIRMIC